MSLCQTQRLRRPAQYRFENGWLFVVTGGNGEGHLITDAIATKRPYSERREHRHTCGLRNQSRAGIESLEY